MIAFDRDRVSWRKATRSGSGNCVQVAVVEGLVLVRNSRNPDGELLTYTPGEWHAFLDGAKQGEFDDLV
jgi:predicted secreted Zn-dependent protease